MLLLHGDPSQAVTVLGYDLPRLHAMLNDFPPALLVTAMVFEIAAIVTRRENFRTVSYWTLIAGVLGGAAAVVSGLLAEDAIEHGEGIHSIMGEHELVAYWTVGIFAVLMLWRILRDRKMGRGERLGAFILGLVGTIFLIDTGRLGGKMAFEHAAGVPVMEMRREIRDRMAGHQHEEGEGHEDHGSDSTHTGDHDY
jgi:uncharacterized membrane protein